ncbi:GNAT family N-acetyltransferase [Spongorhabdus nitratireducens]
MIQQLAHQTDSTAREILAISREAWQTEAALIGICPDQFPPLAETLTDILTTDNRFYGFLIHNRVAAVIEVEAEPEGYLIARLVVSNQFSRQGIATQLLRYIKTRYSELQVTTATDNIPAVTLYQKQGFSITGTTRCPRTSLSLVHFTL